MNQYAGVEAGWDKFEVKTGTYFNTSDGNFTYSGLSILLRGRYPNDTILTPYASIGWTFLSGEVDYNPEWHQNGRRNLYPDDTTAFSVGGGCEIEVARNWSFDLAMRYIKADFDVEYKLAAEPRSRGTFNFQLDNTTVQAGVSYRF
jgi:opacity protein-like surface antigen